MHVARPFASLAYCFNVNQRISINRNLHNFLSPFMLQLVIVRDLAAKAIAPTNDR